MEIKIKRSLNTKLFIPIKYNNQTSKIYEKNPKIHQTALTSGHQKQKSHKTLQKNLKISQT